MATASIRGVNIHYQRAGVGPDLVLVHGLAANLAFWYLGVFPALRPAFRVTAYDLRGHGCSEMVPFAYTSKDMAGDLAGLLDHLGVERAHVVGHSFGAAVALHFAVLCPRRVTSLILADPWVPALLPAIADELAPPRAQLLPGGLELEGLARVHHRGTAIRNGGETARNWRTLLATTTARRDVEAVAGLTVERMRSVQAPTLAVFGARSRFLPGGRLLEQTIPDCTVCVVPEAGHFHPLVKPRVFARHVRDFLGSRR